MKGEEEMTKAAFVALIVGILGMLLGGGVLLVSVLLPPLTNGRTSWEEAMLGIIPGALVLLVSFFVAVVGLFVVILKRRTKATT
jgi:uncharacterized membrane protein YhiD involved in acid resistance